MLLCLTALPLVLVEKVDLAQYYRDTLSKATLNT